MKKNKAEYLGGKVEGARKRHLISFHPETPGFLIRVVIAIPLIRSKKGFLSLIGRDFQFRMILLTRCLYWRGFLSALGLCCFQLQPCRHEQVIRYDRTPEILPETGPSRPGATGKPKGAFELRDIRFNAGAEVLELPVHPLAKATSLTPLCFAQ